MTTNPTPAAAVAPVPTAAAAPIMAAPVATNDRDAERDRIGAIMDSAEGKDRPALARHLAFKTSMSSADAIASLAIAAKEVAPVAAARTPAPVLSAFEQHMNQNPGPQIAPATPPVTGGSRAEGIFASAGFAPVKH